MNKIVRIEEDPERYDLAGKAIGFAMKAHNEGLLLNFGATRLEFKKKFRLPKTESASF